MLGFWLLDVLVGIERLVLWLVCPIGRPFPLTLSPLPRWGGDNGSGLVEWLGIPCELCCACSRPLTLCEGDGVGQVKVGDGVYLMGVRVEPGWPGVL